jgi:hypothetical protein
MAVLQGKGLTVLASLLAAGALAGAAGVASVGHFAVPLSGEAACTADDAARAAAMLSAAHDSEGRGDVAGALSAYRAAVAADARLADRKDPRFLGEAFERRLNEWIAGLKSGRIPAGTSAQSDASYLFRRMYGGCG